MAKHLVVFQPMGKRGYIQDGKSIMEAGCELGIDLQAICGGQQTCGKCRVRIEEGYFASLGINSGQVHLSSPTQEEMDHLGSDIIAHGYRLACAAKVSGDLAIFVPEQSQINAEVPQKITINKPVSLILAVQKYYVKLIPSTLELPKGDWEMLSESLSEHFGLQDLDIDYYTLRSLSNIIQESDWEVTATVFMGRKVIKVEPGLVGKCFGLAIDIGTTTLAVYLCDLLTGHVLAAESSRNPQVSYGEDVIARISYATQFPEGLEQLNSCLVGPINDLVRKLIDKAGIVPDDILDVTVVGNTAMHHMFLNIHPRNLAYAPFTPALQSSLDVPARDLGLKVHPAANVHVLPIEAGFVGADNVGVLIAEEPYNQDSTVLIMDIGTNGELVVWNRQRLFSTSCATGPAFEGAHIKYGMRAAEGAIERVTICPQTLEVRFKVVGDDRWSNEGPGIKARGICGSGVIDAVAQMLCTGIITPRGAFNKGASTQRLRRGEELEFVLAWSEGTSLGYDITITQSDIRAVQLAKGALLSGAQILMKHAGVEQLDGVVLAGAFGQHIDKNNAMRLGLFPQIEIDRVSTIGNAAGEGARLALLNLGKRQDAVDAAQWTECFNLSLDPGFQKEFVRAMIFPAPSRSSVVMEELGKGNHCLVDKA